MKAFIRLAAFAIVTGLLSASAAAEGPGRIGEPGKSGSRRAIERIPVRTAPPVDLNTVRTEDAERDRLHQPRRFAIVNPVSIRPETDGEWERTEGRDVWRLRIRSEGARSLNLGFGSYRMPRGGEMLLYASDFRSVIRPFTARDNQPHGQLWTPVIPSDEIVVEVTLPAGARSRLQLELTSINVGYRGFGVGDDPLEKSGTCNVDVVCPQGDAWQDEIPSVGVYSLGGGLACTGAMINNTAQDQRPYFLTASHCNVNAGNAPSMVVYWNFETTSCAGVPDGAMVDFQSGATFRAGYGPSDFALVELTRPPDPAWGVSFSGWDRSGANPSSAIAIHHPSTDEKRISFENQPTTVTSYLQSAIPGDGTHIRVADWDLGTTEGGSSGSPLFDPNHRIIGQLHGGFAACGNDADDWYGRLSVSWTGGGSSSTRLSNWLDPGSTGALTVDTLVPPPVGGCCTGASCSVETEPDCLAAAGTYLGDDVPCIVGAGSPQTFAANTSLAIPDDGGPGNPASHTIQVPASFTLGDVDVDVEIVHTYVGDLIVTLSHLGTTVTVIDRMRFPNLPFGCSEDNLDVQLDDQGMGGFIDGRCAPGLSSPPGYLPNEALAAFQGMESAGDWTLTVSDNAADDLGTLISWGLRLDGIGPAQCFCQNDADCDDGTFCNGIETCDESCVAGEDPCPFQGCDESTGSCFTQICDFDGTCGVDEDCNLCPAECDGVAAGFCGDEICEPARGEDCLSCAPDCAGVQTGSQGTRYCCGDLGGSNPVPCSDSRCVVRPLDCTEELIEPFCCGDLVCGGGEDLANCVIDCGSPPPVPDGTGSGSPLRVGKRNELDGPVVTLDWDAASCRASGYHVLHGNLATVETLLVDGSLCGLDNTGSDEWVGFPTSSFWLLVVSEGGDQTEGTWGFDGGSAHRGGTTPSGVCGTTQRDNTGSCP